MKSKAWENFSAAPASEQLNLAESINNSALRSMNFGDAVKASFNSASFTNAAVQAMTKKFYLPDSESDPDQLTQEDLARDYPGLNMPKGMQTIGRDRARALNDRRIYLDHQDRRTAEYMAQKPLRGIAAGFIGWVPAVAPEFALTYGMAGAMRAYAVMRRLYALRRIRGAVGSERAARALKELNRTQKTFSQIERMKNREALIQGSLVNVAFEAKMYQGERQLGRTYDPTIGIIAGALLPVAFRGLGKFRAGKKGLTKHLDMAALKSEEPRQLEIRAKREKMIEDLQKLQPDESIFYSQGVIKEMGLDPLFDFRTLEGKAHSLGIDPKLFKSTELLKDEIARVDKGQQPRTKAQIDELEALSPAERHKLHTEDTVVARDNLLPNELRKLETFKRLERFHPKLAKALIKTIRDLAGEYGLDPMVIVKRLGGLQEDLAFRAHVIRMPNFLHNFSTIIAAGDFMFSGTKKSKINTSKFSQHALDVLGGEITKGFRADLDRVFADRYFGGDLDAWYASPYYQVLEDRLRPLQSLDSFYLPFHERGNMVREEIDNIVSALGIDDFHKLFFEKMEDTGVHETYIKIPKLDEGTATVRDLDETVKDFTPEEFFELLNIDSGFETAFAKHQADSTQKMGAATETASTKPKETTEAATKEFTEAHAEATKVATKLEEQKNIFKEAQKKVEAKKKKAAKKKSAEKSETIRVETDDEILAVERTEKTIKQLQKELKEAQRALNHASNLILEEDAAVAPQAASQMKDNILDIVFGFFKSPTERARLVQAKKLMEFNGEFYLLSGIRFDEALLKMTDAQVLKVADEHARMILFLGARAGQTGNKQFKGIIKAYETMIENLYNVADDAVDNHLVMEKIKRLEDILVKQKEHIKRKWAGDGAEAVRRVENWQQRVKDGKAPEEFQAKVDKIQLFKSTKASPKGQLAKTAGALVSRNRNMLDLPPGQMYDELFKKGLITMPKKVWMKQHKKIVKSLRDLDTAYQVAKAVKEELFEFRQCILNGGNFG